MIRRNRNPPANRKATDAHVDLIRKCALLRRQIPTIRELSQITGLSDSVVRHISSGDIEYKTHAPPVLADEVRN